MPGICGLIEIERRGATGAPEVGAVLERMVEELRLASGQVVLERIDDGAVHVAAVGYRSPCLLPHVAPAPDGIRQLWFGDIRAGTIDGPLEAVSGSFSGIRWNPRDSSFELFGDKLGTLPLYWRRVGPYLLFAPEVKAPLAIEPQSLRADPGALAFFLSVGYMPPQRTHFTEVRRLPPAGRLSGTAGAPDLRLSRYWRYEFGELDADRGAEAHAGELTERLREAMGRQLARGERACVCLSGGGDSRTVFGLALERGERPDGVTWGWDLARPASDVEVARELAAAAGITHRVIELDPAALPAHAAEWVWQTDGAIDGLYNYPHGLDVFRQIAADQDVLFRGEQSFLRWPFNVPDEDAAKAAIGLRPLGGHGFWWELVRPGAWAVLEAADRAVHQEVSSDLLAIHPQDRKDEYIHAVHQHCKMSLLNHFKMLALAVRNPLLDPGVLDLVRRLPRRHRQGKALLQAAGRPITERFAAIPHAAHTNLIPWSRLLGQDAALGRYIRDTLLSAPAAVARLFDRARLEAAVDAWLEPPKAEMSSRPVRWQSARGLAKRIVYSSATPAALRRRLVGARDPRRRIGYLFRLLVLAHYADALERRGIGLDWTAAA